MSHRFRALEDLELELRRAIERPRSRLRPARRRGSRLLLVTAAVVLLLGGAAVALAATGVILTGAAVPASRLESPAPVPACRSPASGSCCPWRVADPAAACRGACDS